MVTRNSFRKYTVLIIALLINLLCVNVDAQTNQRTDRRQTNRNYTTVRKQIIRKSPNNSKNTFRFSINQYDRAVKYQQMLNNLNATRKKKKEKKEKEEKEKANSQKKDIQSEEKNEQSINAPKQKGDVQLTVFADGPTKEEAIQSALRSAIEQAFGTFVSSHTEILNDELVKDEIATVSSGNIKSFECLSENYIDGKCFVTVKTLVSTSNLITYTKSKGGSAELAGATFAMNMKLEELNKQNEIKAIQHLVYQLAEMAPSMFDYEIKVGEFYKTSSFNGFEYYKCPIIIKCIVNKNANAMYDMFISTLDALELNMPSKTYPIYKYNIRISNDGSDYGIQENFYLRENHKQLFYNLCNWLFVCSRSFKIIDDFGEYILEFIPQSVHDDISHQNFSFACDHIELSGKSKELGGYLNILLKRRDYWDSYFGEKMLFIPSKDGSSNDINHFNIYEGYMFFYSLEEVSKISHISIESIKPKMNFSEFLNNVMSRINNN